MIPTYTARIVDLPPLFDGDPYLYLGFVLVDDKQRPYTLLERFGKTQAGVLVKMRASADGPLDGFRSETVDGIRAAIRALLERE